MSMQIPDYSVFAQMPVDARRQSLDMIKQFAASMPPPCIYRFIAFRPDADLRNSRGAS